MSVGRTSRRFRFLAAAAGSRDPLFALAFWQLGPVGWGKRRRQGIRARDKSKKSDNHVYGWTFAISIPGVKIPPLWYARSEFSVPVAGLLIGAW